jgi:formylglycine-generating enzyme required for sulfatase activity
MLVLTSLGSVHLRADVMSLPAGTTSLELVEVGSPGNAPDANGRGAVPYAYRIGRYEVTCAQYVEFLNLKGRASADGTLWNNDMGIVPSGEGPRCDIRRAGESGSYSYSIAPERRNLPVNCVSFQDACRFCNWLHNGQGDGDTEDGAYTLGGYLGTDGRRIRRNPGARFFVPTEDEWYKAAYFDPGKTGGPGYWNYPTRSDDKPDRDVASVRGANYFDGELLLPGQYFTDVGAFRQAVSAFGTYDQAGNLFEWTEGFKPPFLRQMWGGSFGSDDAGLNVPAPNRNLSSNSDNIHVGFRVAAAASTDHSASTAAPRANASDPPESASAVVDFPRRPWRDPQTGKPFFPLAWFCYDSNSQDIDAIADQGGNLILFINSPSGVDDDPITDDSIRRMRDYLDHAQSRQVKVLVQLASWYGAFDRNDEAEIGRQKRWVEAVCGHPALLGYQLYDEPEYHSGGGLGVSDQQELKRFVDTLDRNRAALRQWDPNRLHMVQTVFNLVPLSSWIDYLPVIDSFQVDRYPCDAQQAYFGHRGDWGPLMMAWSMSHGVEAMKEHPHLRNPSPCMQGVGLEHTEGSQLGLWRAPLYEETRYMAYSSLTVGSWGVFHWIRNFGRPNNEEISRNVGRLHRELRQLIPAFVQSYEQPPFAVRHNYERITREFLTDSVADVTSLALADEQNYYLIASNNSGMFPDVAFRLQIPGLTDKRPRVATALNEGWSRDLEYDEASGEWLLRPHSMCFGDINIWVIPKAAP